MRVAVLALLCAAGVAGAKGPQAKVPEKLWRLEGASTMTITEEPSPSPLLVLERSQLRATRFTVYSEKGEKLVVVELDTGRVRLFGNPNLGARRFWDAVGRYAQDKPCKTNAPVN